MPHIIPRVVQVDSKLIQIERIDLCSWCEVEYVIYIALCVNCCETTEKCGFQAWSKLMIQLASMWIHGPYSLFTLCKCRYTVKTKQGSRIINIFHRSVEKLLRKARLHLYLHLALTANQTTGCTILRSINVVWHEQKTEEKTHSGYKMAGYFVLCYYYVTRFWPQFSRSSNIRNHINKSIWGQFRHVYNAKPASFSLLAMSVSVPVLWKLLCTSNFSNYKLLKIYLCSLWVCTFLLS